MAEHERTKVEICAELERARAGIARNFTALRSDLNVPRRVKSTVRNHKTAFIGGAALLGLLVSKLPARRKKIYVDRKSKGVVKEVEKAGLGLMLLQLALKAAKPALMGLATQKLGEFARTRT